MKSLFDSSANRSLQERIEMLSPDAKPLWGTMTVAQTLKHLNLAVRNALGEVKFERSEAGKKFAEIAKPMVFSDEPFGKNLPSDENFIMKDDPDFLVEKTSLIESLKKFSDASKTSNAEHPFFGVLTSAEWDQLIWKHVDHHLIQFGV